MSVHPKVRISRGVHDLIRQHRGPVQVTRAVKVKVPGKHFPQLTASEQKELLEGTVCEYAERHKFELHRKAWGQAHTGPGIRFICVSDAIDDPDHKGFWTTLALWNRWRHETYKDDRVSELQYLDELPTDSAPPVDARAQKAPPEVKGCLELISEGVHTYVGTGKLAGNAEK